MREHTFVRNCCYCTPQGRRGRPYKRREFTQFLIWEGLWCVIMQMLSIPVYDGFSQLKGEV